MVKIPLDEKYNIENTTWGVLAMMVFATREEGKPTIKFETLGSPRPAAQIPPAVTPMMRNETQTRMATEYLKWWVRSMKRGLWWIHVR